MLPPFSGALIGGGKSVRMGTDKAFCQFEGEPFWSRQWRLLDEAGAAERFFCGWRRTQFPESVECIPDAIADSGPLGGLTAALERARHPKLLVLALDMPRLLVRDLQLLLERATGPAGCVAFRDEDGGRFYEPLVAVYPRAMAGLARRRLESGHRALQSLLEAAFREGWMETIRLPAEASERFGSCNRPTDL